MKPRPSPRQRDRARTRGITLGRGWKIAIAVGAFLLALGVVGQHTWRSIESGSGAWVAGDLRFDNAAANRRVAWGSPSPLSDSESGFGAGLDEGGAETRVSFAPDGRSAIVANGERGREASLWFVELEDGRVLDQRPIAELDEPGDEVSPWFDGRTLWFASDRSGGRGGLDLYRAHLEGARFGSAESMGEINSSRDDLDPTVSGGEIVFASDRDGNFDLWSAFEAGGTARRIDELSGPLAEREPAFSPDGGSLWMARDTERGSGSGFDLVRAFRFGTGWLEPQPIAALCTSADERAPCPIGSGFELVFARPDSDPQLWLGRSVELGLVPALPWTRGEILLLASLLALAFVSWLVRGSSRWDTLIVCWTISILLHILLLVLLDRVLVKGYQRGAGPSEETEGFQLTLTSNGSGTSSGSGRGAPLQLQRASISGGLVESALGPAGDLSAELVQTFAAPSAPGRTAAEVPESAAVGAELTQVEEPASGAIPAAAAAPGGALPTPGRSARVVAQASESERWAGGPGVGITGGSGANALPAGPAIALAAGTPLRGEAPAPATTALPATGGSPTAVADAEPAGGTPQSGESAPRRDPLASLAPASSSRGQRGQRGESAGARSGDEAGTALERSVFAGPSTDQGLGTTPGPSTMATLMDDVPRRGGGESGAAPPERAAATPYQTRTGPQKERALEEHGGTKETEAAVVRGLAYLARIQGQLGQWGPLDVRDEKYGEICVGKTGLATLAFLAAGHTHVSGTEHSETVQKALAFLLASQDPKSGHFGDSSAYSHGITTFALAEALSMTGDATLRASVEQGVAHILAKQSTRNDPRFRGGWPYYYPNDRQFDEWPRTSITVWQILALESARLSGVTVPDKAFEEAASFLEAARDPRRPYYRYNHDPNRLNSGYPTLPASTPAALFALSCLGRDITSPDYQAARQFVLERAPNGFRFTSEDDFVQRAQGNPYFWYQGSLAMMRVGGDAWRRWNVALQETLLPSQEKDGSWKSIDPYAKYARDNERDRAYTTALCVLCLEVYYRYDLPLLKAR